MTDQDDHHFPGLSRIGALLADPGRAAMLWVLMDGSARPAGELTMIAGLSPSAASAHLARLTDSGLLALDIRGRHRYYRLASSDVAASLEALANVARAAAPNRPVPPPSRTVPAELRYARTCYDHMAGELAVRIFDGLTARGWLHANGDAIETTDAGAHALARWGIDVAQQRAPAPLRVRLPRLERAPRASWRRARRGTARQLLHTRLDRAHRAAARAARHRVRPARFRRLAYVRLTRTLRADDNRGRWTGFVTSDAVGLTKHRALKQPERIS